MEVNEQNIGTLRQLMGSLMSYDNKARKEGLLKKYTYMYAYIYLSI
jgi:hypothetical protein